MDYEELVQLRLIRIYVYPFHDAIVRTINLSSHGIKSKPLFEDLEIRKGEYLI